MHFRTGTFTWHGKLSCGLEKECNALLAFRERLQAVMAEFFKHTVLG